MHQQALLNQRIRQFLVHSFLYYQLGESLVSDEIYDRLHSELKQLVCQFPHMKLLYPHLIEPAMGPEGSGFFIKKYPLEIISVAVHLLYELRHQSHLRFDEFVLRQGYRLTHGE